MTKAIALEFAPNGIRVNTIGPTFIEIPLAKPYLAQPEMNEYRLSKIKLDRIGQVEDLIGAIVFLASDAAALITDAALPIGGVGRSAGRVPAIGVPGYYLLAASISSSNFGGDIGKDCGRIPIAFPIALPTAASVGTTGTSPTPRSP
jgi:hypothetical protein